MFTVPEEKHRKFISTVIYWGLVLLLCWVGIRYVLLWLLPFLLALGVASIMEPTVCFLREKLRLRRGFISAILSFVLLALLDNSSGEQRSCGLSFRFARLPF